MNDDFLIRMAVNVEHGESLLGFLHIARRLKEAAEGFQD